MTDCTCTCHINPFEWVPTCPTHHLALYAAEAGMAQCPWVSTSKAHHVGGLPFAARRCVAWEPKNWLWRPRAQFHGDDLPPYNGHQAPRYPDSLIGPHWEVDFVHRCPDCKVDTPHAEGSNRLVCLACGLARWVPDFARVSP
jgi:hypothetical protein